MSDDKPTPDEDLLADAAAFVLVNLLVDLAYGWLDPRISYR